MARFAWWQTHARDEEVGGEDSSGHLVRARRHLEYVGYELRHLRQALDQNGGLSVFLMFNAHHEATWFVLLWYEPVQRLERVLDTLQKDWE